MRGVVSAARSKCRNEVIMIPPWLFSYDPISDEGTILTAGCDVLQEDKGLIRLLKRSSFPYPSPHTILLSSSSFAREPTGSLHTNGR